jgi:hypothetical protein
MYHGAHWRCEPAPAERINVEDPASTEDLAYPGVPKLLITPILHAKRSIFSAKAIACDVRCRSAAKDCRQGLPPRTAAKDCRQGLPPRTAAKDNRPGAHGLPGPALARNAGSRNPDGPNRSADLDLVSVGVEDGRDGRVAPGQLQRVRRQFGQRRAVLRPRLLDPSTAHHLAVFHQRHE